MVTAWTVTGAMVSTLTVDEELGVLILMKRLITRQPTEGTAGVSLGNGRVGIGVKGQGPMMGVGVSCQFSFGSATCCVRGGLCFRQLRLL